MSQLTRAQLATAIALVTGETTPGANTCGRVGGDLQDIVDSLLHYQDTNFITAAMLQADAVVTAKILDKNVTLAKIADVAQGLIAGRAAGAGTGVLTMLTAAQIWTILGEVPFGPGWMASNAIATTAARYLRRGEFTTANASEIVSYFVSPCAFVLRSMRFKSDLTTATDSTTYTCRVNGSDQASLQITIGTGVSSGSATGAAVNVAAGDRVSIKGVATGTEAVTNLNPNVSLSGTPA